MFTKLFSVMVSTDDFDSSSNGSNPLTASNGRVAELVDCTCLENRRT